MNVTASAEVSALGIADGNRRKCRLHPNGHEIPANVQDQGRFMPQNVPTIISGYFRSLSII
jgi:hypothetical protein